MKLTAEQSKVLKTCKMREAELAAQRAKIKKVRYNSHCSSLYLVFLSESNLV